jgi:hypothetical protein
VSEGIRCSLTTPTSPHHGWPITTNAKRYTDDFPLTMAGFLEWFFIPLMIPLPIESLFRGEIDVSEPYDRPISSRPPPRKGAPCSTTASLRSPTALRTSVTRIAWPWSSMTCRSASSASSPTARR